jgi:hypothetical protein
MPSGLIRDKEPVNESGRLPLRIVEQLVGAAPIRRTASRRDVPVDVYSVWA